MIKNIKFGQYINACFFKSAFREVHPTGLAEPFGLIVATQGPMANTVEHFWEMVIQQNVIRIVTLC